MSSINLAAYGLTSQYLERAKAYDAQYQAGRILSQEKGLYRLIGADGEQAAEVSGRFRHNAACPVDFPVVGDFVVYDANPGGGNAVIHAVLPRKSIFIRRAAGTANEEQAVAANIDTVFICMSLNNDYNLKRLERYLSVAWESGATPAIVLTKADLCPDRERAMRDIDSVAIGVDVILTSAFENNVREALLPHLQSGRTIALIGSSGVGKSTIINRLLGEQRLETGGLRNDDKGRHTTTRRELFLLPDGCAMIDTPGMRELGLSGVDAGLDQSFADVEALARGCRFRDCSHTTEPHCAVREAIAAGRLSEERLHSYIKLREENLRAEDMKGYLAEKKQKFKSIAIINKSARKK